MDQMYFFVRGILNTDSGFVYVTFVFTIEEERPYESHFQPKQIRQLRANIPAARISLVDGNWDAERRWLKAGGKRSERGRSLSQAAGCHRASCWGVNKGQCRLPTSAPLHHSAAITGGTSFGGGVDYAHTSGLQQGCTTRLCSGRGREDLSSLLIGLIYQLFCRTSGLGLPLITPLRASRRDSNSLNALIKIRSHCALKTFILPSPSTPFHGFKIWHFSLSFWNLRQQGPCHFFFMVIRCMSDILPFWVMTTCIEVLKVYQFSTQMLEKYNFKIPFGNYLCESNFWAYSKVQSIHEMYMYT